MVNTVSTDSIILTHMNEAPEEFVSWLKQEFEKRNWAIRAAARRIGVSHPTISDIVTLQKQPSYETCMAIAKAFNKSPVWILRLAGLLPKIEPLNFDFDEWRHVLANISDTDRAELMEIARGKLERTNETWNVIVDGIWQLPQEERDRILKDQAEIIKETLYKIGGRRDK